MMKNLREIFEDESFIRWAKGENIEKWEKFIKENPSEGKEVLKIKILIKNIIEITKKDNILNDNNLEKEILWNKIQYTIKEKDKTSKIFSKIAAVFIPLIFLSIVFYSYNKISKRLLIRKEINYVLQKNYNRNDKITLITKNNEIENIESNNVNITYFNNGETNINNEKIIKQHSNNENIYNKIMVPFGKRCEIIFSDGSKMYLNSGSFAVYPICFDEKIREVYVEGEAFFEVKNNKYWPFIVKTKNLNVKVLGTKFNLTSYNDEKTSKVVLVEGKIQANIGLLKKYTLEPGNLLSYDNYEKKVNIEKIEVTEYISWKDGWLLCKNENLTNILKKLSRYYNINFEFSEEDISNLKLTGKLDLKDDIIKVLETISKAIPISYLKIENNKIAIIRDETIK